MRSTPPSPGGTLQGRVRNRLRGFDCFLPRLNGDAPVTLPWRAKACTHLLISDRRLRKTRVLSIVAAVPTCRHFQNRGSSKSLYLSRFSRCVHALAWRGRVDATRRCEASSGRAAGWGDGLSPRTVPEWKDHPTRLTFRCRSM